VRPTLSLPLHSDGVGDLRSFAVTVQEALNPLLGDSVPSCPAHGVARSSQERRTTTSGGAVRRAPAWGRALERTARRRHARGNNRTPPTADEAAIREVAEPVALLVTHVEPIPTKLLHEPADHRGPSRRVLTISGPGAMRATRLEGILRRAGPGDDCDFLVEGRRGGHCVRVRLAPDHPRGGLEGPVVLDHTEAPFADDGIEVVCGGGSTQGLVSKESPGYSLPEG
jgi:hypothetical protein